jgi:hypothetical protein
MISYAHTGITSATNSERRTCVPGDDYNLSQKIDLYTEFNQDDPSTSSSSGNTLAFGGRFKF